MERVRFFDITLNDGFWKEKQQLVQNTTVQAVYDRFVETHRFEALACGWKPGEPNQPHIFWDSDVAKWIEGAAYLLQKKPDAKLERIVDTTIDTLVTHADEQGYFNSHFLVTRQEECFCHRGEHELYCAGHLIEAAVAYWEATGKDRFLKAMCRYADYIDRVFRQEKSAAFVTPGHPELELALMRLYQATGELRYANLAKYFIEEHGRHPEEADTFYDFATALYNQDEMPLRRRTTAEGHSVRALYLFCGMADVAQQFQDAELLAACERVFDNIVNKRMYITGGVGSTPIGEAFTVDYDLPNRQAYAETCAAIALALFAGRMQALVPDSRYADTVERALYNGVLSGISLDGKSFFYVNPLEIDPAFNNVNVSTKEKQQYPITQRVEVFECSCCPPNLVRFLPSVADFMYSYDETILYVHQYLASEASFGEISLQQKTRYPHNGKVTLTGFAGGRTLALRVPGWCKNFTVSAPYELRNGYALIATEGRFEITVDFAMPVRLVRGNRRVHADAGRVAVLRGPVVYCAEGVDNGSDLCTLRLPRDARFSLEDAGFGLPVLKTTAWQLPEEESLYCEETASEQPVPLTLIPYYAFANRGETEMVVWLLKK